MFSDLFQLSVLGPWLLAMLFGVFVGATPGLTATMAVALIVPVSFYMPDPNTGLAMIIGVSFTAIFAGDIPATFLRIPGTPASAAATLDGYQLSKKGKGGFALTLDLYCSSIGGLVGVGLLVLVAPQLAGFALRFSNFEYFWLAVFGLSMSAMVSAGNTRKGLMSAALGVLFATVGIDIVSGSQRFTFGQVELMSGLGLIPVMIGLFGVSEVLRYFFQGSATEGASIPVEDGKTNARTVFRSIWKHRNTVGKSSLLGAFIGSLPGAGADIAAWAAYGLAQRTSKNSKNFGKGEIEGVVAPTSANNASMSGAWIPALVFGIPGDAVTAIVLGALMMYEIKPGPLIFEQNPEQIGSIFAIAALTQLFLIPCGFLGIKTFGWILRLPKGVVMVAVLVFSVVGSYALRNSVFDIYVMATFGLIGFYLESQRVPLAPMVLGVILGPMLEENLRIGLIKTEGSLLEFVNRPICIVLILLLASTFALPRLLGRLRMKKKERSEAVSQENA